VKKRVSILPPSYFINVKSAKMLSNSLFMLFCFCERHDGASCLWPVRIAYNVWHGEAALNAKATGQPIVLKYILNNMP